MSSSKILSEYEIDLGGVTVWLIDSAVSIQAENKIDDLIEIQNLNELVKTAALARILITAKLTGKEIKFLRNSLDMSGKQFAKVMEISPETVSRWENESVKIGKISDKLIRHTIGSILYKKVWGVRYSPEKIAMMKISETDTIFKIKAKFIEALIGGDPQYIWVTYDL